MHDEGPLRAQVFQDVRKHLRKLRIVDADKLGGGAGGIRQGAQHVEDRPDADFPARSDGVFHGAVQSGREQKADADLLEALLDDFRFYIDVDAQRLQDVGAAATAGDGAVAVLGHGESGRRDDKGGRGGDIEGVHPVAAGPAGVDDDGGRGHPPGWLSAA